MCVGGSVTTINEKGAINLKKIKELYMRGFGNKVIILESQKIK